MTIHRIHTSTGTADPAEVGRFYRSIFGMDCRMEAGWAVTLEPGCAPLAELVAEGDEVPDLEVAVDDVDAVHLYARQIGADVPFGPWTERSGVRRIFLRDPAGSLVSVTSREAAVRAA